MDKYLCNICKEDVRYAEKYVKDGNINYLRCRGPRHKLADIQEERPIEEVQTQKHGLYVNPITGRIERISKTLNNPTPLGKE
jgi:hypothetical protein